jgi:hypothetical protein
MSSQPEANGLKGSGIFVLSATDNVHVEVICQHCGEYEPDGMKFKPLSVHFTWREGEAAARHHWTSAHWIQRIDFPILRRQMYARQAAVEKLLDAV